MTREQAVDLMAALVGLDVPFGEVDLALARLDDGPEKTELRRAFGALMADTYINLIRPIEMQHPGLNPDRG